MPYAIIFFDDEETQKTRSNLRERHIEYVRARLPTVLASGGLLSDDGEHANGGLIILDTDDREVAEEFVRNDPFLKGGVFSNYTVVRWRKAFLSGRDFLNADASRADG